MHRKIYVGVFAFFVGVLCSCDGAPMNEQGSTSTPLPDYTVQEERLIIDTLLAYRTPRCSTWKEMEKEHKLQLQRGTHGFNKERTAVSFYVHFYCHMLMSKSLVAVTKRLRETLRKPTWSRYSFEEDVFIIKEVLSSTGKFLNKLQLWDEIKQKHDQKRRAEELGFFAERTAKGLRLRLHRLVEEDLMLAEAVKEKFPRALKFIAGGSGKDSSEAAGQPSPPSEELQETGFIDFFEKELQNIPGPGASVNAHSDDGEHDELTVLKL